jgi:excisionase family DNA binding protein
MWVTSELARVGGTQQETHMTTRPVERNARIVAPRLSAAEAEMARAAQRCLMAALDHSRAASITIESDDGSAPAIQLPPQALKLIAQLLGVMSERRPVVLMPSHQELTTVEAANFLNVSRPFVIKEIEAGRLKHRMVGSHRRIEFEDLQAYATQMRANQKIALQRMADDAREQGLEY